MFQFWTDDTRESVVFSFHLVWLFYEAVQGGADTNELFRAVRKVRAGNDEDWYRAFFDLADRIKAIAMAVNAGTVSPPLNCRANSASLRASSI